MAVAGAHDWQTYFVSSNQHLCVCKISLWLEVPDDSFQTAADPNSDISCSKELICKLHCYLHNLHLASFILKIVTACVRFQGLTFCLFSAGG